jgi:hypothetical protein
MIDLPPIDARTLDAVSLRSEISSLLQSLDLEGKLVRMQIKCVPSSLYKSIDFHWLRSLTSSALHFEPKLDLLPENASVQSSGSSIDSLEKEWDSVLESHPLERANKDRIRERGIRYLQEAEESD